MQKYLKKLFLREHLTAEEAREAMDLLMDGKATPEQIGAFLAALATKGESVDEIVGFVRSIRAHATPLTIKRTDLIDTCGTGGDGLDTFNISTAAALVLATAGLGVVKHGNRSVSSRCGSADVLETLGIPIDLSPDLVSRSVDLHGFGFLFAKSLHPAFKHVAPVRQALGVRTIFNVLGPLTNPAGAKKQVIGVFSKNWLEPLAQVLAQLGAESVLLVHGRDGLDEVSLSDVTDACFVKKGAVQKLTLQPADFGISKAPLKELHGGDASENAKIITAIFAGEKSARRDIVVINAAAALVVAGKAADWQAGRKQVEALLDSGQVRERVAVLKGWRG